MGEIRVCDCGERVWIEWHWNGLVDVPTYYDAGGQLVSYCPGCGDALQADDLRRADDPSDTDQVGEREPPELA